MLTLDTLIERDLECGGTVVTPSPQRAAAVRLAYGVARLARGARAWRTPDAIAYRAWLVREAFRAADAGEPIPRPLAAAEEWLLWRQAAADAAPAGTGLQDAASAGVLADSLSHAARLMFEWRIPPAVLRGSDGECEWLARALEQVEMRCHEAHAAPSHALARLLRAWRPGPVTFAGFTERSAARGAWLEEPAVRPNREAAMGRAFVACASDPTEELQLAADWCRSRLATDPQCRLLVVVPDLAERRGEALRLVEQVLTPRAALAGDEAASAVAVEGGEPLAGYPLVRHGLLALEFLTGALELAELSAWLRDAFWRAPTAEDRARLDAWLRRALATEVAPRDLLQALQSAPAGLRPAARQMADAVAGALEALEPALEASPILSWARRFARSLEALGWPGTRPLTSVEQQTKARLEDLLAELVAMGAHLGALEAQHAVRTLRALAARTSFAPQSGDAAVTLTESLSDPLVRYDGIWVAGLHADAWPAAPRANPFIPLAAQIRAGIPEATVAGTLAKARVLLDRWCARAPQLVVSWPQRIEDRDCLVSPLLAEVPGIERWAPRERPLALARVVRAARRTESFTDGRGAPWSAREPLPGGARAIEYQSRCPFRSYAELRLACVPLERPRPGIDPRTRGRLMHRALELLWRELGGSEGLSRENASGALGGLIERCVARASRESLAPASGPSGEAAQRRERRRIARLLHGLSALELERASFRVSALELPRSLTLAGARLDLRIDRIDELEDGTRIILDYKTGRPAPLEWLSDRLTDPQLLLYLLAAGGGVGALAMVHLTTGRIAFRGLADRPGRLPRVAALAGDEERAGAGAGAGVVGVGAAWQDQVRRWQGLLEQLARDFLEGAAAVDPVPGACRICHLHTLCRVSETQGTESSDG